MKLTAAAIVMVFAASACQSAPPPASVASVSMYQYVGSKQCEQRAGTTLDALTQQLAAAGVRVQSTSCGHDGRMYAQTCGSPDGCTPLKTRSRCTGAADAAADRADSGLMAGESSSAPRSQRSTIER